MDAYKKAITVWERKCAEYLAQKGIATIFQPMSTNDAKIILLYGKQAKAPDLICIYRKMFFFVEVKNYDEFTPLDIFLKYGKLGGPIQQLRGIARFRYMQKNGFKQGLDCSEIDKLSASRIIIRVPIFVAFNCTQMLTYDNGKGLWYGTTLAAFRSKKEVLFSGKKQKYVKLSFMRPIDEIIKNYFSEITW